MHVAVIGAGVVGATTADVLAENGCRVTVVEAHDSPAMEVSHANGAQLSYSFTDAMASPDLLWKIPKALLGKDPGLRIALRADARFLRWSMKFLVNCTRRRFTANSDALVNLAAASVQRMARYHRRFGCEYAARQAGKLVMLPGAPSEAERNRIAAKQKAGCDIRIVSGQDALQIEPALAQWSARADHAIYSREDEVADARQFTRLLLNQLADEGVELIYGQRVTALQSHANGTCELIAEQSLGAFDAVVLCTGREPERLLQPHGITLPIYPVAGYSVTLPAGEHSAQVSVTALEQKLVFSRLADKVRIAGFADMNQTPTQERRRQQQLLELAEQLAPQGANYRAADACQWTGYRPMTPSSVPIVGPTRVPGLYLNLGHGMLGWTLAAGSAGLVAQAILEGERRSGGTIQPEPGLH